MARILHFHLPKTAGVALRTYLAKQVGAERVSSGTNNMRMSDALVRWRNFDVISGHFSLRHGDQLPKDRHCITVLREPIDRFLSEFFFHKNDNPDRLIDSEIRMMDLDAYLDFLSNQETPVRLLQVEMLYPLGTSSRASLSREEELSAAIRALDGFDRVGVHSDLDDLSAMLEADFSWPAMPMERVNVTSSRLCKDALPPHQQRILRRLFESESELYQQARERFLHDRRASIRSSLVMPGGDVLQSSESMVSKLAPDSAQPAAAPRDFGDGRCVIKHVVVRGEASGDHRVMAGEMMDISVTFEAIETIDQLTLGLAIRDGLGGLVFGTNSKLLGDVYEVSPGECVAHIRMLNRMVEQGSYSVDLSLTRDGGQYEGCYHWLGHAASFEVYDSSVIHGIGRVLMDPEVGIVAVSQNVRWRRLSHITLGLKLRVTSKRNNPLIRFLAEIQPRVMIEQLPVGTTTTIPIRVQNLGVEIWPAKGQQNVVLSYRWLRPNGDVVVSDGIRTPLSTDVQPGGVVQIPLRICVPDEKGDFILVLSPVQELVAWFCERESESQFTAPVAII